MGRRIPTFLLTFSIVLVCATSIRGAQTNPSDAAGAASPRHAEEPKELDGKGLFALPEDRAARLKVKSVVTGDWLHERNGLTERKRGFRVEYDLSGRLIKYSGHVDQRGPVDLEYAYAEGRLVEEKHFRPARTGEERILLGRAVYDYSQPKTKVRVIYNAKGEVQNKVRYSHDDADRVVRMEALDPSNDEPLAAMAREYDKSGNLTREIFPEGLRVYSHVSNVLTVSTYNGPKPEKKYLHSTKAYTFDTEGNLVSYLRTSGDGKYWDKFTYGNDRQGLPKEKTWSRMEFMLQDPYELTRYSYEYRD
jgi:hypothetical protein